MSERLTKDKIIQAVLDTTFYQSVGATSLTDIANALHIKKASLYNHFDNREDLLSQTTASCSEYIDSISFIPQDVQGVAKKYSPETVLKGMVNRYFKMHEKNPLFQIYTYLQSTKYFDPEAAKIVKRWNEKMIEDTEKVLEALAAEKKLVLSAASGFSAATWFCNGVNQLLEIHLLEKKKIVIQNPASGEGELFSLPTDDSALEHIGKFIDHFVSSIK